MRKALPSRGRRGKEMVNRSAVGVVAPGEPPAIVIAIDVAEATPPGLVLVTRQAMAWPASAATTVYG